MAVVACEGQAPFFGLLMDMLLYSEGNPDRQPQIGVLSLVPCIVRVPSSQNGQLPVLLSL